MYGTNPPSGTKERNEQTQGSLRLGWKPSFVYQGARVVELPVMVSLHDSYASSGSAPSDESESS